MIKEQNVSDKVAGYLFYFALSIGIVAAVIWMIQGDVVLPYRVVTVL